MFQEKAQRHLNSGNNFSFQTNFDKSQTDKWRNKFSMKDFQTHLYFLYVDDVQTCIDRVSKRVLEGGHFVPENEIINRYHKGLNNFDAYFSEYNNVKFIDTSKQTNELYLEIKNKEITIIKPEIIDIAKSHKLANLKAFIDSII